MPFNRGVAASDHAPPSVSVDATGSGTPAMRAAVASGTAVKLPRVVIRPSSHVNSASCIVPSATASRVSPMLTCPGAKATAAGAASRSASGPRPSSESSVPDQLMAASAPARGDAVEAAMGGCFDGHFVAGRRRR